MTEIYNPQFESKEIDGILVFYQVRDNHYEIFIPEDYNFPDASKKSTATSSLLDSGTFRLGSLRTKGGYQKQGLASKIIKFIKSLPEVKLITANIDPGTEKFYTLNGFKKKENTEWVCENF